MAISGEAKPTERLGLLLVGHGTREAEGVAAFLALNAKVAEHLANEPGPAVGSSGPAVQWIVEPCFLELAEPTIAAAIERLRAAGVNKLVVAPVLLFSAGHIQRDIPQAVAKAIAGGSPLTTVQAEPLGCHPRVVELSALRFGEALAREGIAAKAAAQDVCLVLIGRGSLDARATAEMHRFAALRLRATPVAECRSGFVAMARPTVVEVLRAGAASGCPQIVVQPHLLFAGQILSDLRRQIGELTREFPRKQWMVVEPLGPHRLLVEAIAELSHRVASTLFL